MIKYEDYQKLIYNLANRYFSITGIERDELISIGNLEFVLCLETHNPEKAKFSTYLTWKIKGRFLEERRKYNCRNNPMVRDHELSIKGLQEESLFFNDILKELSSDAKEIVKIVFNTPTELIEMLPTKQPRGVNKHQIQKHLRRNGWNFSQIWNAFGEITKALF